MKRLYLVFILLFMKLFSASSQLSENNELLLLKKHIVQDTKGNILGFWEIHSPDPSGGFYGELRNDGTPVAGAEKGGVLNARILWTFSSAYHLIKDDSYKELADRAQEYFLHHFVDPLYGGTYWSVDANGNPVNTEKQTYGIAYAIYGLSEHYRATGDEQSLQTAITLYNTLEKYAYDPINGGYIESFTREWGKPPRYGYDGKGVAPKTMNTHLHVLEAYTNLYRVWPDAGLKQQLKGIIDVFINKIIDKNTWHEKLFLTMDWVNLENIDSYGHDMELSWLLLEAAEVLGDESLISQSKYIAVQLVETQMKEGWTEEGWMIYEKADGHIPENIEWWPQAESVVAFLNAWQITNDRKYLDAMKKTWHRISQSMIDYQNGEWFKTIRADGTPDRTQPKASMWKCPYHNARMGFEVFKRIKIEEFD